MVGDTSTWLECNKAMLEYIHPQYLRDEIDVSLNFKSCNEIRSHYVIGTCICKTGLMQYFMFIWLKTLMVKYSNVQKIMTFLMYVVLLALCKNLSAQKISAQS